MPRHAHPRRVRLAFAPVAAALVSVGCLIVSATGTTGSNDSLSDGGRPGGAALVLTESSEAASCTSDPGTAVSLNASTCAALNELGGKTPMIPGHTNVTRMTITNAGTVDAGTMVFTPSGPCTQVSTTPAGRAVYDLCARIRVTITSGPARVFAGTAATLGRATPPMITMPPAPAAGHSVDFTIRATLDPDAGNTYMGLEANLPVQWTLTS